MREATGRERETQKRRRIFQGKCMSEIKGKDGQEIPQENTRQKKPPSEVSG